jgi:hypothetical protein
MALASRNTERSCLFCAVVEERPDVERVSVNFPKCFSASLVLKVVSVPGIDSLDAS